MTNKHGDSLFRIKDHEITDDNMYYIYDRCINDYFKLCDMVETRHLFDQLKIKYNKPVYNKNKTVIPRYYHTWEHIRDGLAKILSLKTFYTNELIIAWFYHDCIYTVDPVEKLLNEENSAEYASIHLEKINYAPLYADHIKSLILATKHIDTGCFCKVEEKNNIVPSKNLDWDIICDVDLSGFATPNPEKYKFNTENIRKEFSIYSDKEWKEGRLKFLKGMVNKCHIFKTVYFRDLEVIARLNINNEILELLK
jgi:predicted metal-dependent HD superfamily phosphohydrolase